VDKNKSNEKRMRDGEIRLNIKQLDTPGASMRGPEVRDFPEIGRENQEKLKREVCEAKRSRLKTGLRYGTSW
jgi:hypothetical protein